ncbi:type VI secretion system lipoprotein TssJ [Rubrivivax gelatinosus]|uniref:Type VI secretion system-associated lipoprotein n=1 Tax=Rubrivivax gelatinosus TaxID=28068 RepID=A0ABS1E0S5_RUBGE|nr:type VI secretion system lipoprotein TssJ [Rubrivivax gelatinosus]MBK1715418.1 type VI secretion system-associated lipoprotein [Rubrivivax gelatinosus]
MPIAHRLCSVLMSYTPFMPLALLAGCAAAGEAAPSAFTRALAAVGLMQPPAPAPAPEAVVELHASAALNAAPDGVAVPTVVQLRWLDDPAAFRRAGYEQLAASHGAHELILVPGRTLSWREAVPPGARALGVVAFFRAPAAGRWKLAFGLPASRPIRLSLHQCAIAVVSGTAIETPDAERTGDLRCMTAD